MARPVRSGPMTATTTAPSTPLPIQPSSVTPSIAPASSTSTPSTTATRASRRRQSVSLATPGTPGIAPAPAPHIPSPSNPRSHCTPPSSIPSAVAGPSTYALHSHRPLAPKVAIEPKAHGLRNSLAARERQACPYPQEYGGKDRCGVHEEDEGDDVLMAVCAACASMGNVALTPDELATIAVEHGWIRQPSVAVAPSTMISNAIRLHQSRCHKGSRRPLLVKYQLSGSTAEAALAPALHPGAFEGPARPKGPVWYLADVRNKWRDPFAGLEVPKVPPRKPAAKPKKRESAPVKPSPLKESVMVEEPVVPRIKLKINGIVPSPQDRSPEPAEPARDPPPSVPILDPISNPNPTIPSPTTTGAAIAARTHMTKSRRHRDILDSSDSDTSDSEIDAGPSRRRKGPPAPLNITNSPRFLSSRTATSFGELFFSPVLVSPATAPQHSPFPFHPLDNTIWDDRMGRAAENWYETSSSSSDDDLMMRDSVIAAEGETTWNGSVVIKTDDEELQVPPWDEETKALAAATDAMRELAAISYESVQPEVAETSLNALDNRSKLTFHLPESLTEDAVREGKLRPSALPALPAALPAWVLSSPVSSPHTRAIALPAEVTSPTQHLSRLRDSFESGPKSVDMDVDDGWLDESGELPVKAEESLSDVELGSNLGEEESEHESQRQLQMAEWARDAAAASAVDSPDDFPSPATEPPYPISRGSSTASASPSSGLSELPFEMPDEEEDEDHLLGPESVALEELEDWLPHVKEKTPRGRAAAARHAAAHRGSWSGIGVGAFLAAATRPSPVRKRSLRSNRRTRRTKGDDDDADAETDANTNANAAPPAAEPSDSESMDVEMEVEDAIGPADLERARAEAEQREDEREAQRRRKEEEKYRCFEACRQAFKNANAEVASSAPTPMFDAALSPWSGLPTSDPFDAVSNSPVPTPVDVNSGAMSPLAIQGMSTLSLGSERVQSLDPKSLLSPPPSATIPNMLEGVPVGFDIDMAQPTPSPSAAASPTSTHTQPLQQQQAQAVSLLKAKAPSPGVVAPIASPVPIAIQPKKVKGKTQPIAAAPRPVLPAPKAEPVSPVSAASTASASKAQSVPAKKAVVRAPATAPTPAPTPATAPAPGSAPASISTSPTPAPAPTSTTTSTPVTAPSRTASPVARTASPAVSTTSGNSSASIAASVTTNSSAAPSVASAPAAMTTTPAAVKTATPPAEQPKKAFRLFGAIDIAVVDNIPTYTYLYESGPLSVTLRRRLDSDFVNVTSVLRICGVAIPQHPKILADPGLRVASHVLIPPQKDGRSFMSGVPGVWVPLVDARQLAARLQMPEDEHLKQILELNLFESFMTAAGLNLNRTSSEHFGPSFDCAVKIPKPAQGQNNARPSAAPVSNGSNAKGPLVRSVPPTQAEGSQPKRRRATFVAGTAPGVTPAAATGPQRMVARPGQVGVKPATPTSTAPSTNPAPARLGQVKKAPPAKAVAHVNAMAQKRPVPTTTGPANAARPANGSAASPQAGQRQQPRPVPNQQRTGNASIQGENQPAGTKSGPAQVGGNKVAPGAVRPAAAKVAVTVATPGIKPGPAGQKVAQK